MSYGAHRRQFLGEEEGPWNAPEGEEGEGSASTGEKKEKKKRKAVPPPDSNTIKFYTIIMENIQKLLQAPPAEKNEAVKLLDQYPNAYLTCVSNY